MSVALHTFSGRRFLFAAAIAGALAGGCRHVDPAVKRSARVTNVLVDTRQSLVASEQTVAESQAAMRTLRESTGDLRPSFAVFIEELNAVRQQAERLRRESELVRDQADVYCAGRTSDISTITNEEMRRAAELRTARMRERCDHINEMYKQINSGFDRYVRDLTDLRTFLASELNYGALESGQRWFDEALGSGETLRGNIRGLGLQVDLASNLLSPVPIPTTQWPDPLRPPVAFAETENE
ncbi:MAG TPA: hypothetical protein VF595_05265 [Tepidisphaeraceae bacterium]